MKKSISFKVLLLVAGVLFYRIPSVFSGQIYNNGVQELNFILPDNIEASLPEVLNPTGYEGDEYSGEDLRIVRLPDTAKITWINPSKQYNTLRSSKASIRAIIKSISGLTSVQLFLNDVLYGEPEMVPSSTEIGSYIISKTVNFETGNNSLYIIATNNQGKSTSEKRFFTFTVAIKSNDSTTVIRPSAPLIIWSSPSGINSTLRSSKTNIKATIKTTSGISSVLLYLNDVLYGEPEMNPSPTEIGSYIVSKAVNFEPGNNSIYLVAANSLGSTTSEKRFFTIPVLSKTSDSIGIALPTAPVIAWTSPYGVNSIIRSSKTNIKATIKTTSGISSVLLYLNDVLYGEPEMEPSPTEIGSYIITKAINFEPGNNSLYLVAANSVGSTTSEKRYFNLELASKVVDSSQISLPPAPSITWAVPTVKSTTLKVASTNIRATIKSASGLKSVVLYLNNVSLGAPDMKTVPNETGSYEIEKTLSFKQVENNIYLEANNTGGVTRSQPRYFICPPSSLQPKQPINPATNSAVNSPVNPITKTVTNQVDPKTINRGQENTSSTPAAPASTVTKPLPAAPTITWTSPANTRTTLESFNGTVRAKITSNSGLKSVFIYLNGISKGEAEIKPSTDDAATFLLEKNINFGPGENNIYLVATNSEGATKSELRYFSNPSAVAPAITWSAPDSPNSSVNTESLKVGVCIKSSTELKSVKLLVNGNIQAEDNVFQSSSASDDCNYNWQSSVVLREGDNSIFIIASNVAGSTTSEKRVIKLTNVLAEKRLALVLGNSNYKNSAPLKNPVNDANLMEATLKDLGFLVIKHLDVGKNEMLSAIREFEDKLPEYNIALFYYAGHGNQVDGKNYLIPVDAKLETPSACKFEAVEVNLIVDEFERYQNNTNIVILDACRNNPFASWARGGEAGFRAMNFTSGTIVAYATSEGATAADGKGANGLYTEELVRQMTTPQSINDVFMNTRVQVRKKSNNQQVPSETNKLNGAFYFRK